MAKKNLNTVALSGNLTRDPEIRFTEGGGAVCNFTVAANRQFKRGEEWVDEVAFIDCVLWGKGGEAFAKYHKRGSPTLVHGHLSTNRWTDKATGEERTKLRVTVEQWFFHGSSGGADASPSAAAGSDDTPF